MWNWLSTPAEPRWLYGVLVGVVVFVLMFASLSILPLKGMFQLGALGGICGGVSGILVKLVMERFR